MNNDDIFREGRRDGLDLLLAVRGWSRGCAALARREFARRRGLRRLAPRDIAAFAEACARARSGLSRVTAVAALLLAARPSEASADILRGSARANPGAAGDRQAAAITAAQQAQAARAERARDALARATRALDAMRAAQDAARAAALARSSGIADGLAAGGLVVAAGATPGSDLWTNASAPVQTVSDGRTRVEIVQSDKKAVLTWDEFNVGLNTELYFNQKAGGADAADWVALNRVTDRTTHPSQILGAMRAEGQVYVVNPNGIVFHGSSQVNVHTLVASGLDFRGDTVAERNAAFLAGLASDNDRSQYNLGVDKDSGRPVGSVRVDAGARLVSDASGAIYLFGKGVSNAGTLSAPDGQVLLASGERIWISKNTLTKLHETPDPDLRGVRATTQAGALAENTGLIESDRGNITLSGKNVRNDGVLHATTSVKANGSVTLLAGDGAAEHDYWWMWPVDFGSLTLGPAGLVAVTPDKSDATGFASQYRPSKVAFYAKNIALESGSTVYAPGASATMVAKTHLLAEATPDRDTSRFYLASGALISLAGLAEVSVAMERNTVTGNLRLDELKDSPLQRGGVLRGARVSVDLRRGTTLADMAGHYALIEYGVSELMTSGGTLRLDSGSIVTREGSLLDLSGGSVRYRDGYVSTTRLLGENGLVYDITTARKDIVYKGIYDVVRRREAGYLEGRDAGALVLGPQSVTDAAFPDSINLTGLGVRPYHIALDGAIEAGVSTGAYQRNAPTASAAPSQKWTQLARSARLVIGYEQEGVYYGPDVRIGNVAALPAGFAPDTPFDPAGAGRITLPARLFDGKTFGHLNVIGGVGGGDFTVDAGTVLDLGAFGTLDFRGARAFVDGSILAPGGKVALLADIARGWRAASASEAPSWEDMTEENRPVVRLGSGARIDVSGAWVNDLLAGSAHGALPMNGGEVSLKSVYNLALSSGAVIDAGGGGNLTSGNRLVAGNGGSILLQNDLRPSSTKGFDGNVPQLVPKGTFDVLAASLSAYSLGTGGKISLGTSRAVVVGDPAAGAGDALVLSPGFFREGGFSAWFIGGAGNVTVSAGTVVTPAVKTFLGNAALWTLPTGGELSSVLSAVVAEPELRRPMRLTLSNGVRDGSGNLTGDTPKDSVLGVVVVETGARLVMEPESVVELLALGDLFVDGEISAPAGSIRLETNPVSRPGSLRLGANARLSAPGAVRTALVDGLRVRSVLAGGSVSLALNTTENLSVAVQTDRGSVIDVSGVVGTADFRNAASGLMGGPVAYRAFAAEGDAGEVRIEGFKSGFLAGRLLASPGGASGAGGSITVKAGMLNEGVRIKSSLLLTDRTTDRVTGEALFPEVGPGAAAPSAEGVISVYVPALAAGGADTITLMSATKVAFDGDIALTARRSLGFASPVIGLAPGAPSDSSVSLEAPYVSFDGFPGYGTTKDPDPAIPVAPGTLDGRLTVRGGLIDIRRTLDLGGDGLGGFATARFVSSGDIRLTVGYGPDTYGGRLQSPGALVLESAQTYVTTASHAISAKRPGFLIESAKSVEFVGNGGSAPVPYSYGETLLVKAPEITQGGVLRAPLGSIELLAGKTLTLAPGSLTSVSAEGLVIPMGAVSGGYVSLFPVVTRTVKEALAVNRGKSVKLSGENVNVAAGAAVDLSGGGDITAYEFIPGNGGSSDILSRPGMFAVLPGYVRPGAPVSPKAGLSSGSLKIGDSVRLDGSEGLLPAGVYTLLPAHYALLKGGVALSVLGSGYAPGEKLAATLPDGTRVISGHRLVAGTTAREAGSALFGVLSGEVIRRFSEYNEYGYNAYLKDVAAKSGIVIPDRPADAGVLAVLASKSVTLDGRGRFGADGGRPGKLDIVADKIALVGGDGAAPEGYLALRTTELNAFGIGSLLVGGTRSSSDAGDTVAVGATDVLVANDAASALVVPEIILASTRTLDVADGAVIRAEGSAVQSRDLQITGDGALLRATTAADGAFVRKDAAGAAGTITLGEGAVLSATGGLSLDGSKSLSNRASVVLNAPSLSLSSARVSLGEPAGGGEGLVLSGATLAALGRDKSLIVRSYGAIDVRGGVSLGLLDADGRPVMDSLILDAAGLNGHGASGETAVIAARRLVLRNSQGAVAPAAGTGSGTLSLVADSLTAGPGAFATQGFAGVEANAGRLVGEGAGSWHVGGDLTVRADLVGASSGAVSAIRATGDVRLESGRGAEVSPSGFGGRLDIAGRNLVVNTTVAVPAGDIRLTATDGDLTLGRAARVSAAGVSKAIFDATVSLSAGTIRLTSERGSVRSEAGSVLNVDAAKGGGDAGAIDVRAVAGDVSLAGALSGRASSGLGGSFLADAGSLAGFSALNANLNGAGFSASRSVRVRSGDITLAAGETLAAHEVSLRADAGRVVVDGTVAAVGTDAARGGGSVTLRGGAGVSLGASGLIDVSTGYETSSSGFSVASGKVAVVADGGEVAFASGARIRASGGVRGGGSVVVTAMRDGADLRVGEFGAVVEGAREFILSGRRDYVSTGTTTASQVNGMLADASAWMANAAAIRARLNDARVEIRPDIRVVAPGDLAITGDISLISARYDGAPGALNFEAGGDLKINGSVSDGFSTATSAGTLRAGRSWSLGFEAGGDITLAAGKLVRTGTGDITVKAGRDLVLTNTKSVIYTAGSKTDDAEGFKRGNRRGDHPVNGGDLALSAGRDIQAPVGADFITGWLYRYGYANTADGLTLSRMTVGAQSSWSVVFANFEQGVGALGGGDVAVRAGRDIRDLSVVLPTTGMQTAKAGESVLSGELVVRGGGNLSLRAGGDIFGGLTMLGRGEAELVAGGSFLSDVKTLQRIKPDEQSTAATGYEAVDLHALFALADATLRLSARGDIDIEGIVDPMMIPLITAPGPNGNLLGNANRQVFFNGYSDRTSFEALSAAGDIRYRNNPWAGADLARGNTARPIAQQMWVPSFTPGTTIISRDLIRVPGTMNLTAADGAVGISQRFLYGTNAGLRLAPSPAGGLTILAETALTSDIPLILMDVAPEYLRDARAPFRTASPTSLNLAPGDVLGEATNYGRGFSPLRRGDAEPSRLYVNSGDIAGINETDFRFTVLSPEPVLMRAGRDIADITLVSQHNDAGALSLVEAGRDILRPSVRVSGAGDLVLRAGRDVDLAAVTDTGIVSAGNVGNLLNTDASLSERGNSRYSNLALRNDGADITLSAGASSADYDAFAARYLDPSAGEAAYAAALRAVMVAAGHAPGEGDGALSDAFFALPKSEREALLGRVTAAPQNRMADLRAFLGKRGVEGGSDAELLAAFRALPAEVRRLFLTDVAFSELRGSGLEVNASDSLRRGSYRRGFAALDTLFGEREGGAGDIRLFGRRLVTQQGGSLRVLAPGGSVSIDVVSNPASAASGVVTEKGGAISIVTSGDIALANSRVFTLQGGDVLMWTSTGDITAGAGSNTSVTPPALVYTVTNDARVLLDAKSLSTGSGIGVLDANRTGDVSSRLDLIAPAGTVDAGDAGIRSVGAINIAARAVIGAANISAGGGVTGVPAVSVPNVAATAAAASASAASTGAAPDAGREKAREVASRGDSEPSVFFVEVLGYGGEAGASEDPESKQS